MQFFPVYAVTALYRGIDAGFFQGDLVSGNRCTVNLAGIGGRFPAGEVLPYWVVQVIGAVAAAAVLYLIASGQPEFSLSAGFAAILMPRTCEKIRDASLISAALPAVSTK